MNNVAYEQSGAGRKRACAVMYVSLYNAFQQL